MNAEMLQDCRIFIAEDDAIVGLDLAAALRSVGATVIGPMSTLEESLQFASSGDFDVAILDVALQGVDAYPVGEAIRQRGIPFVLATGQTRKNIPDDFQDVPHWLKPFSPQQMAKTLAVAWQSRTSHKLA